MGAKKGRTASIFPRRGEISATAQEGEEYLADARHMKSSKGRNESCKRSGTIAIFVFRPPKQGTKNCANRSRMGSIYFI